MMVEHAQIGAGFADPIMVAQGCFRRILNGMSEPGSVQRLDGEIEPPSGCAPAAVRLLLTLADVDTPVWLASPFRESGAAYVRFHCGAPIVDKPAMAQFALVSGLEDTPSLAAFNAGDERYPDRSATVIVQCTGFSGGTGVALTGPGIRDAATIAPAGLHPGFWEDVAANTARYPLGVDVILAAGDEIICVPRTSRVRMAGEAG